MIGPSFTVKAQGEKKDFARIIIEPLDKGYGQTLGVALRRVLLSSIRGAAITSVKISGVRNVFSALPGLKEDVIELLLNVKQIRLKLEGDGPAKMELSVHGPKEVKAGDIEVPPEIKIVNPDFVLGNLADKKSKLDMEMTVEAGYGYSLADERPAKQTGGSFSVDAIFTPIVRVNYQIESTRVGRQTNLDRLILDIWSDGTMKPSQAAKDAAKMLIAYFQQVYKPNRVKKEEIRQEDEALLTTAIEELDLPTRVYNALIKHGQIDTIKKLVETPRKKLSGIKNLGEKSIDLIERKLKEKNLSLSE